MWLAQRKVSEGLAGNQVARQPMPHGRCVSAVSWSQANPGSLGVGGVVSLSDVTPLSTVGLTLGQDILTETTESLGGLALSLPLPSLTGPPRTSGCSLAPWPPHWASSRPGLCLFPRTHADCSIEIIFLSISPVDSGLQSKCLSHLPTEGSSPLTSVSPLSHTARSRVAGTPQVLSKHTDMNR